MLLAAVAWSSSGSVAMRCASKFTNLRSLRISDFVDDIMFAYILLFICLFVSSITQQRIGGFHNI